MNIDKIIKNFNILKEYIKLITNKIDKIRPEIHNKYLKNNNSIAILCENIIKKYNISLAELKYIINNNLNEINRNCLTCNKPLKTINKKYCSRKCAGINDITKNKRKNTCLDKYGVDNNMKSPIVVQIYKQNYLKKYGVESPFSCENVKQKIKKTNKNKYGTEYVLQSNNIKDKIKSTNINKYKVDNIAKSQIIKDKIQNTCLTKYGVKSPMQGNNIKNNFKQNYLNNHGVENPFKDNNVKNKIKITKKIKKYNFFLELLQIKKIQMLSTYDEHLNNDTLKFKCLKCNKEFKETYIASLQHKIICPHCYKKYFSSKSKEELQIFSFIKNINNNAISGSKKIIPPYQLDIYIPDKKLAIEYNGIYWHSDQYKNKYYHLNKTNLCKDKGIILLHIFENEWLYKQEIVKSIINSKLNIYKNKIFARKCEIKELNNKEYKEFLELNHIQGYANAFIKIGLFYNNELVACIGIGKSRFKNNETELIRFCNKLNTLVIGGLSRLIKYSKIEELISYVDLRYFNGSGYEKIGFELINKSSPSYVYAKHNSNILSRYQCQKHKLYKLLGNTYNKDLTEEENMILAGYYKIYDCGMLKYRYKK